MSLNVERLTEIRDWLLSGRPIVRAGHKFGFDLHSTIIIENETGTGSCGSTCCIAGAALLLTEPGDPRDHLHFDWRADYDELAPRAAKRLGLDPETAEQLFLACEWADNIDDPEEEDAVFEEWGGRFSFGDVTNEWAAAVLDNLIATGRVDWSVGRPDTL